MSECEKHFTALRHAFVEIDPALKQEIADTVIGHFAQKGVACAGSPQQLASLFGVAVHEQLREIDVFLKDHNVQGSVSVEEVYMRILGATPLTQARQIVRNAILVTLSRKVVKDRLALLSHVKPLAVKRLEKETKRAREAGSYYASSKEEWLSFYMHTTFQKLQNNPKT